MSFVTICIMYVHVDNGLVPRHSVFLVVNVHYKYGVIGPFFFSMQVWPENKSYIIY